ncbi:MAG: DNA-3-methyladenine glycosylase [Candidatus Caldarchaeum sp.]|nr:DNA-3-methyladenine glycosylase [Candidatus Caldarchaeum sp.]MCX8201475.1 DNA-3-methyladenine glycosylase [Candidatus Caldarchaeum sp.]MDW8434586.1 DNA-3-methyladenine glycosylase [Candidatus Caldarchaeum sp.]
MRLKLGRSFYDRDTVELAQKLLGKIIVVKHGENIKRCRIVETEAYVKNDRANHAYRGMTQRNKSMFGPPGILYVYTVHTHYCMNVVRGGGEAVLIRAAEPLQNVDGRLDGPGRLCRELGVDRSFDGVDLCSSEKIWLEDDGYVFEKIAVTRRIGVTRDKHRLLRFFIADSPWVSRKKSPSIAETIKPV